MTKTILRGFKNKTVSIYCYGRLKEDSNILVVLGDDTCGGEFISDPADLGLDPDAMTWDSIVDALIDVYGSNLCEVSAV